MKIWINRAGQNIGTLDSEEVQRGLDSGRYLPTDLGWREGMKNWKPLSELSYACRGRKCLLFNCLCRAHLKRRPNNRLGRSNALKLRPHGSDAGRWVLEKPFLQRGKKFFSIRERRLDN